MLQEDASHRSRHFYRQLTVRIDIFARLWLLHQRNGGGLQRRKKTFFVEGEQCLHTTEDNLPLRCRNNGLLTRPYAAYEIDGCSTWPDVDIDQLLQSLHIGPLSPVHRVTAVLRSTISTTYCTISRMISARFPLSSLYFLSSEEALLSVVATLTVCEAVPLLRAAMLSGERN